MKGHPTPRVAEGGGASATGGGCGGGRWRRWWWRWRRQLRPANSGTAWREYAFWGSGGRRSGCDGSNACSCTPSFGDPEREKWASGPAEVAPRSLVGERDATSVMVPPVETLLLQRASNLIRGRCRPSRPHRRGRRQPGGRAGQSGPPTLASLILRKPPSARGPKGGSSPRRSRTRERRRDPPRDRRALVRGALVRKYKKQHILYFCFCLLGNPEI